MDTPRWLTEEYLEAVLRKYCQDGGLKIAELHINPALGKGENFGGILLRVRAKYLLSHNAEPQQRSFIVKSEFEGDEFVAGTMKPYDIFNREISIYEHVVPKLHQILAEVLDDEQLCPRAVHVDYERQALIFEDLSEQGYVMADRTLGLDVQHVTLILRKLAKMHATSAVLNERSEGVLEKYDRGFFNRYTDNYSTYFLGNLLACSRLLRQWEGVYTYYSNKLLALHPNYMEIGKRCFAPTADHVNVLAHGDVWTNNVMFKYDTKSGAPVDVLIIDFQYSFWGSPTLDLHHFFNTSLQEDLRLHQQDMLMQYYHRIFAETLRKLDYRSHPVPNLHLFRSHAEQKRFFALHSAFIAQPVMLNEEAADADFRALVAEDQRALNFKTQIYQNKKVQAYLKNLLPIFDRRGLLDANQCD